MKIPRRSNVWLKMSHRQEGSDHVLHTARIVCMGVSRDGYSGGCLVRLHYAEIKTPAKTGAALVGNQSILISKLTMGDAAFQISSKV